VALGGEARVALRVHTTVGDRAPREAMRSNVG
jgi:hypothetical protein